MQDADVPSLTRAATAPAPRPVGTPGSKDRARGADFGPLANYLRDPFPALSHWAGVLLSIAGTVALLTQLSASPHRGTAAAASILVYGVSLVLLFAASAYSHTALCSDEVSERLVKIDYAAIFLLIAGTYTPVCVIAIAGTPGLAILAAEWVLAGLGMFWVTRGWRGKKFPTAIRIVMYIVMGWLGLAAPGPVLRGITLGEFALLCLGGAVYTAGAIVFVTDRPKLWVGKFVAHDLWHLMVIAGAALHWIAIRHIVG